MSTYPIHKHLRRAALFGAAALAAIACSREAELEPDLSLRKVPAASRTVRFHATEVETKAQFGEAVNGVRHTLWTENGPVKISLNYASAVEASVTPADGGETASFSAEITYPDGDAFTFYSICPASAAQALSPSREAWKVSIPCVQEPTAGLSGSVDEAAIIIAATSTTYDTAVDDVDLAFNHLTAYGRFSLNNLSLADGETITSVELTTTTPIVGDWYWNTSGTLLPDFGASSSTLTINTASASDIWFACAPVDVSGEYMTITVFTTHGAYEQLIQFSQNRKFTAGQVAVFSVDMDGAAFPALPSSPDPMLSETAYGCYLGTNLTRTLASGTDQVTRAYDNDVLTYTIIDPDTVEEVEITGYTKSKTKGSPVNVSIYWRQGTTVILNDSYSMSVIKEEGPKVWLSDGNGLGVIIKK